MKYKVLIFLSCCSLFWGCLQARADNLKVNSAKVDTLSYAMGYQLGSSFRHIKFSLQENSFMQGLQAGYNDTKPVISIPRMKFVIQQFRERLLKQTQAKLRKIGQANLAVGRAFLAKNKHTPGVQTLANGLQYKIIRAGTGTKPLATDAVVVDYEGKLIDGTVFDSSYQRGKPAQFAVNQVISGWTQVLQLMRVGAVWEVYVPSNLGYGTNGAGRIPPNSVLIFKIHLLKIVKKS